MIKLALLIVLPVAVMWALVELSPKRKRRR